MTSRSPLERIVAEVREQPPPLGAPELTPRLRAEFRRQLPAGGAAVPSPRARPRRVWPLFALASAAALALVVWRHGGESVKPAVAVSAELDGRRLAVGAQVVAGDGPRRVEHPGRASWELAPGSRARLVSMAGIVRVALEEGKLSAEVRPSDEPESFVVQARGTEVAVHGTRFSVSLSGERVHVSVSRGLVRVRPLPDAAAPATGAGTDLGPGMQADFVRGQPELPSAAPAMEPAPSELDPASPATAVPSVTPSLPPRAEVPALAPHPGERTARGAAPARPLASAERSTPPDTVERGAASRPESASPPAAATAAANSALHMVAERVQSCFREELSGSSASEVGIEAVSTMGLWVEPDGTLLRADFDPPLAPAVERCVAGRLAQLRFAASPEGYRVQREVRLRR